MYDLTYMQLPKAGSVAILMKHFKNCLLLLKRVKGVLLSEFPFTLLFLNK